MPVNGRWAALRKEIMGKIDLCGSWGFCLDGEKEGIKREYYKETLQDTIILPATVSTAKRGKLSEDVPEEQRKTGSLTDPYYFEGYTWYTKTVELADLTDREFFLVLERTRISHVWIGEEYIGSNNSLCTSHRYNITPYIEKEMKLTIMVDNTPASYPVAGGHMTSVDTQTNWNGITGEIYIEELNSIFLSNVRIYPDAAGRLIKVRAVLNGAEKCRVRANVVGEGEALGGKDFDLSAGENLFSCELKETDLTWSEHTPNLCRLNLTLLPEGQSEKDLTPTEFSYIFGLRDFKAAGHYFEINGSKTFLRGKHDGLIFPLTGHPPMDLDSWLRVLGTAKEYGINHYRFHTCCPPGACFEAADILGIYLEPELPFWGTVTEEGEENHNPAAQQYLIEEGCRILDEFGNHPSFVMMSMGNELWGSKKAVNHILKGYKSYDDRHLYTQGSNNFQFMPSILDQEDFFCGVRFSRDRLFRGSYAMCDAPLGHIQTSAPDTVHNYDSLIRPGEVLAGTGKDGEVTIQYGTGTKTVKVEDSEEVIPEIPVVSHEIGQYAMYPDFSEISKYTGVLKAENLKIFRERIKAKGMLHMADAFFKASGSFAADCYKAEIETALRSRELAGFQLLDLQDFSGQGTALVGILNAFMENKGILTSGEWRQFCSDAVLLAELPGFVYAAGEEITVGIKLALFRLTAIPSPVVELCLLDGDNVILKEEQSLRDSYANGIYSLCDFTISLPEIQKPRKLTLQVSLKDQDIENHYALWVYPERKLDTAHNDVIITESLVEAIENLEKGRRVILYPDFLTEENSIQGTYCTDFWCYPMFRSISESMDRPIPVGTHGLLIKKEHKIFRNFPTEAYTTAQWYDLISGSRAYILEDSTIEPIVWTIDNFERNHKLGNLFEVRAGEGRLLVCTLHLQESKESLPARWFEYCLTEYAGSDDFQPENVIDLEKLKEMKWL